MNLGTYPIETLSLKYVTIDSVQFSPSSSSSSVDAPFSEIKRYKTLRNHCKYHVPRVRVSIKSSKINRFSGLRKKFHKKDNHEKIPTTGFFSITNWLYTARKTFEKTLNSVRLIHIATAILIGSLPRTRIINKTKKKK